VRFKFGKNWSDFVRNVGQLEVDQAKNNLVDNFDRSLLGKTFADVGCGSGLFSLAAIELGADVTSFDFDPLSVETCNALVNERAPQETDFLAFEADVLDQSTWKDIGHFDFVYSWGVLHHTGDMHLALKNVAKLVKPNGYLFIAIYNDQGLRSKLWWYVKYFYNRNIVCSWMVLAIFSPYFYLRALGRFLVFRRKLPRGMNTFYDMIDWLGGFPFEVAKPCEIKRFYQSIGFQLTKENLVGSKLGCNEFVFKNVSEVA
tara:strand:+ start:4354 stop:5127 length:774 start_codon:yes stop_codon:yes gene_type:complete